MGIKRLGLLDLIWGRKDKEGRKPSKEVLEQKGGGKAEEVDPARPLQATPKTPEIVATKKKEKRDLIVGFDLGTACTKVVIQDPSVRLAYAVPLSNQNDQLSKYLLPTEIRLSPKNEFSLQKGYQQTLFRHLKLLLLEKPDETILLNESSGKKISGLELTTVYVALVLKKAREWFMREHAKIYEGVDIYWHLNIGMPVKNYDEKEIKENFQRMAIGAWWLSMKEFPIILDQATGLKRLVSNKDFNPGIHPDYINVVPEVAAQVAGYARSQLREEGLHMLVDIGASTLDTATFLLNKEQGDDRYVFMTARIERVGCLELHFRRLDIIEDYLEKWVKECKECFDITSPIPRFPDGYHPELERLKDLDEEFLKDVCHPVRGTVALTKTNRDPNSEKWVEGLPIFLCGGGSQVEFYNPKMIKRVEEELAKNFKWNGFRQSTIPKPENLKAEGLHSRDYHRLSVAYGLSFPIDDIGKIVPPSEVDDIKKQPRVREYEFISKDQV